MVALRLLFLTACPSPCSGGIYNGGYGGFGYPGNVSSGRDMNGDGYDDIASAGWDKGWLFDIDG